MNAALLRRARPLLGTLVSVQVPLDALGEEQALHAMEQAFAVVVRIHRAMSAHASDSDLARLAQAAPGQALVLDACTVEVLRLAQSWRRTSGGAFDAQAAGERLARGGERPGIADAPARAASLAALRFIDACTVVPDGPVAIDLGGIAKGYAVDQAVATLRELGVPSGLVNAGGDLRAFGEHAWPIELQHPELPARSRRLLRLRDGAVATSLGTGQPGFVATRRTPARWRSCTVLARDCATADALTKWGLQDREPSLALRRTLRQAGARMWRS